TLGGQSLETSIILSNPGPSTADVTLQGIKVDVPEPRSFQLGPGKTRQVTFKGDPLQVGAVRLISTEVIAASAHITIRRGAGDIISEIVILGQPLTSKAVIPVFVKTALAENTAIAIVYNQGGCYRFTLLDAEGRVIGTRTEPFGFNLQRPSSNQAAMFVTELFPNITSELNGSLILEHVAPLDIPLGFAISAFYVHGSALLPVAVTPIDKSTQYIVTLRSSINAVEQANALATQYGFTIFRPPVADNIIGGLMTHEVARAVARDQRVLGVSPNNAAAAGFPCN
ncbi:MAG TPA: hypothetical protein VGK99_01035, partial [Acidobacteriota bacterium]